MSRGVLGAVAAAASVAGRCSPRAADRGRGARCRSRRSRALGVRSPSRPVSQTTSLSTTSRLQVELDEEAIAALAARPEVERLGQSGVVMLRPSGTDIKPGADFYAAISLDGEAGVLDHPAAPRRGPDAQPVAAHEILLDPMTAERLGVEPGDEMSIDTMTFDALLAFWEEGASPEPDGPTIAMTVTGIAEHGGSLLSPELAEQFGTAHLTPALQSSTEIRSPSSPTTFTRSCVAAPPTSIGSSLLRGRCHTKVTSS